MVTWIFLLIDVAFLFICYRLLGMIKITNQRIDLMNQRIDLVKEHVQMMIDVYMTGGKR